MGIIKVPYQQIHEGQNKKLTPASLKKGVINAIYVSSWTADVQIIGGTSTILKNVPINLSLSLNDIKVGDRCKLDLFDETNPNDMVIAYTYGRAKFKKSNSGSLSMAAGAVATITHGLGIIPDILSVDSSIGISGTANQVYISTLSDANTFKLTNASPATVIAYWYAAVLR